MIELFWLCGAFVGLADATQLKAWLMHTLIELLQVYFLGGIAAGLGWILEHYVAIIRKTELDCSAIFTGKDMHAYGHHISYYFWYFLWMESIVLVEWVGTRLDYMPLYLVVLSTY